MPPFGEGRERLRRDPPAGVGDINEPSPGSQRDGERLLRLDLPTLLNGMGGFLARIRGVAPDVGGPAAGAEEGEGNGERTAMLGKGTA